MEVAAGAAALVRSLLGNPHHVQAAARAVETALQLEELEVELEEMLSERLDDHAGECMRRQRHLGALAVLGGSNQGAHEMGSCTGQAGRTLSIYIT